MKHTDSLSTYTPAEFKKMANTALKQYRKEQPSKSFLLDKPYSWFLRVANDSTVLVIQIKDNDGWVRDHTIRL